MSAPKTSFCRPWPWCVALLLLGSGLAFAGDAPSSVPADSAPALEVTLAVLLHSPKDPALCFPDDLRAVASLREFATQLANGPLPAATEKKKKKVVTNSRGPVRTLVVAQRQLIVQPGATACFNALECRPAFTTDAGTTPESQPCGLELVLAAALPSPSPAGNHDARPAVLLNWAGTFAWSEEILVKWEKYAYTLFKAAKAVPGLAYTSQGEDEDGFISGGSSGTINLGSLFGKKPKAAPAELTSEPSFLATPQRNQVVLQGGTVLHDAELLVLAFPATAADQSPRVLYFALQSRFLNQP